MKKILRKVYITPNQNKALSLILDVFDDETCISFSSLVRSAVQDMLQDYESRKIIWQQDPDFYIDFYKHEFNENHY